MIPCPQRASIERHFDGTISPESEHVLREHLPVCAACHAHYERWLLLSRLDPEALSAETRILRGLGLGRRPSVVRPFGVAAAATLVAAAAALLFWIRAAPEPHGFTARGGGPPAKVSRVFVYDVHPGKPAEIASESVARGDELAFAYENGAAKNRLMIFGVDEHRHVYWFYPAWVNPSENPVAVPVERDERRHELPEAVRQDFDGSRLEIRSVFLDAPLTVAELEAMLRDHPVGPLPIPGAVEATLPFAVAP